MKRLFVLTGLFLTLLSLPLCVKALESSDTITYEAELNILQGSAEVKYYPSLSGFSFVDAWAKHKDYIANELRKLNNIVDISSFNIPKDEFYTTAGPLAQDTINENPDLFYVANYVKAHIRNGMITKLEFKFNYQGEELKIRTEKFNAEVNKALAQVDDSMTDFEKLLVLHDYLSVTAQYNTPVTLDKELADKTPEAWSAYGVLVDKIGVCQSYSLAYKHLLDLLGIDCHYAISTPMSHIWNVVRLGENYYHVDITWDDPVFRSETIDAADYFGYAEHTCFLLSDEAIMANEQPHYDWVANYECSDTSLDIAWFKAAKGPIAVSPENYYYALPYSIMKYDKEKKASSEIHKITEPYYIWDNPSNYYPNIAPNLFLYDGKLYFNTPAKIQTLSLDTNIVSDFYEYKGGKGYIYGIVRDENFLLYCPGNAPVENNGILSLPLGTISAEYNNNEISVTLNAPHSIEGKLIVSVFDGNDRLISSEIYNASPIVKVGVDATGSYARLLWWNFASLTPYSESFEINL